MSDRVAVFVDGENVSFQKSDEILNIGKIYGKVDVARVYGNAASIPRWSEQPGYRLIHAGVGKNATDLLLSLEAFEFAFSENFNVIVIVSSDSDFTHLLTRIRELGRTVIGIGEKKTTATFRAACSQFHLFAENSPVAKNTIPITEMDKNIRSVIAANSQNGQGMKLTDLNPIMRTKYGTQIGLSQDRTWRSYLSNRPELFEIDPKGAEAKVRFKPKGFS